MHVRRAFKFADMHEISICESILNGIEAEVSKNDLEKIREIHLKVGVLSCIEPEIMKELFHFMIVDTPFRNSELFIDVVKVHAQCKNCGCSFRVEKYRFVCPACGEPVGNVTKGKELLIHKIILEEPEHEEINQ